MDMNNCNEFLSKLSSCKWENMFFKPC